MGNTPSTQTPQSPQENNTKKKIYIYSPRGCIIEDIYTAPTQAKTIDSNEEKEKRPTDRGRTFLFSPRGCIIETSPSTSIRKVRKKIDRPPTPKSGSSNVCYTFKPNGRMGVVVDSCACTPGVVKGSGGVGKGDGEEGKEKRVAALESVLQMGL